MKNIVFFTYKKKLAQFSYFIFYQKQRGFQMKPQNLVLPFSTAYWQHTRQPEG